MLCLNSTCDYELEIYSTDMCCHLWASRRDKELSKLHLSLESRNTNFLRSYKNRIAKHWASYTEPCNTINIVDSFIRSADFFNIWSHSTGPIKLCHAKQGYFDWYLYDKKLALTWQNYMRWNKQLYNVSMCEARAVDTSSLCVGIKLSNGK